MKKQKEEFEKQKNVIKEQYEKSLNTKYEQEMKNEINKLKNSLNHKLNEKIEELKKIYIQKYEKKEVDMDKKFNEMSQLVINKSGIKKNDLNLSICNTVHRGVKCEKCFAEPIIGYRYKCSVCNNYNLCQECEEKNSVEGNHPHDFIKIRKEQNNENKKTFVPFNNQVNQINNEDDDGVLDEINDENKEYSYECINILNLSVYMYKGTENAQFNIILKNNGIKNWPQGISKLIFDKSSNFTSNPIILKPQKPGEQNSYEVNFNGLSKYLAGEYKSYLLFCVNNNIFGEKLLLRVIIKEKNEPKNDIDKYIDKINEFRDSYGLTKAEFPDEKILEVLKKNEFDLTKAFESLFD